MCYYIFDQIDKSNPIPLFLKLKAKTTKTAKQPIKKKKERKEKRNESSASHLSKVID